MTPLTVGDLVDAGEASIQTGPFGTQFKAAEYVAKGIPMINVKNIADGAVKTDELERVSIATRDRLKAHILSAGDIVFGRKGAVERHAFIRENEDGWVQGSDCIRLRIKSSRYLSRYLSYMMLTPQHRQWMFNQCSHGATMASLNQGILRRIQLPSPPVETQRRVIAILQAYDELIDNNERRSTILDEMARAAYRDLVDANRSNTRKRGAGQEWRVKPLSEVATVNELSIKPATAPPNIEYVDIASVSPGRIDAIRNLPFTEAPSRARRRVRDGDTIWSSVRPNLRAFAFISQPNDNLVVSTGFAVMTPTSVPASFLYYCITTDEFMAYLVSRTRGAAYPAVSAEDFEQAELLIPDAETLRLFDDLVAPMMRLRHSLSAATANLRQGRESLIPKLVSGSIDVSDLDINTSWLAA